MRLFSALYQKMMMWARHRHAQWYLVGLSFAESSFFPIPPDVMLAPMSMAKPQKAWWYAFLTTSGSVVGGVFAYWLSYFFMQLIHPYIVRFGYESIYNQVVHWFRTFGIWIMFFVGFLPIPYKIFTLAAGAVAMPFMLFLFASCIGRGCRFFLVAALMRWGGELMEKKLLKSIDYIAWVALTILVATLFIYRYHRILMA